MKVEIKRVIWPSLLSSIFLLLLGLLLFFKSSETLVGISYLVGGVLIALGVIAIINYLRNSSKDIFVQLNDPDWINFNKMLLLEYGLKEEIYDSVKSSIINLLERRLSVKK